MGINLLDFKLELTSPCIEVADILYTCMCRGWGKMFSVVTELYGYNSREQSLITQTQGRCTHCVKSRDVGQQRLSWECQVSTCQRCPDATGLPSGP